MSIFKMFASGKEPTHAEVAERELEETRILLLDANRKLEAAQGNVNTLRMRESRLAQYVADHPTPQQAKIVKLKSDGPIQSLKLGPA